ncbi:squalene/phytoene synthase family protein [Pseudooceanicola spongiae]|uniref:squalene/phytoene synthase family protein n=1 Tax=Pseudooceanicola spongiae TaxID=2613965 RepID=UPI001D008427|nr:squalene/phytoene synthase family protein [Pseudooceanicola spongiae]
MPNSAPVSDWTDDLTACASLVERGDPGRFRAVMAAPLAARLALFPLYAFNIEVARAPWVTQEPMIAEMRLQWWRDALEEIGAGTGIRRHDVVTPLSLRLSPEGAAQLDALVDARRWDVWKEPFEDAAQFEDYLDVTSGNLLRAGAVMLGARLPEAVAADAGYAIGLANWLRAVPELEASGRYPLPDGRRETVQTLATEGLVRIARARQARGSVDAVAAPLLFGVSEAQALLKQAAREPGAVVSGALAVAPFRERIGLAKAALTGRW